MSGHERFKRIKTLDQGSELCFGKLDILHFLNEGTVIELAPGLLLLEYAHLAQDSDDGVQVERHAAVHGADGHQVEHSLRVESALVNT